MSNIDIYGTQGLLLKMQKVGHTFAKILQIFKDSVLLLSRMYQQEDQCIFQNQKRGGGIEEQQTENLQKISRKTNCEGKGLFGYKERKIKEKYELRSMWLWEPNTGTSRRLRKTAGGPLALYRLPFRSTQDCSLSIQAILLR